MEMCALDQVWSLALCSFFFVLFIENLVCVSLSKFTCLWLVASIMILIPSPCLYMYLILVLLLWKLVVSALYCIEKDYSTCFYFRLQTGRTWQHDLLWISNLIINKRWDTFREALYHLVRVITETFIMSMEDWIFWIWVFSETFPVIPFYWFLNLEGLGCRHFWSLYSFLLLILQNSWCVQHSSIKSTLVFLCFKRNYVHGWY